MLAPQGNLSPLVSASATTPAGPGSPSRSSTSPPPTEITWRPPSLEGRATAIAKIKDDAPRAPAVLRAQLRRAAEHDRRDRGDDAKEYLVAQADLYEVAVAFPAGPGIDGIYEWVSYLQFVDLICSAGSLAVYGDLSQALTPRFDPALCLTIGGMFDHPHPPPPPDGPFTPPLPRQHCCERLPQGWDIPPMP